MKKDSPKTLSANELHAWLQNDDLKPLLIDVREEEELEIALFPSEVIHLPLSTSSTWLETLPAKLSLNKPIVVICHAGIRSWNFGQWLLDQNLGYEVWNLKGGIDAWEPQLNCN